MFNPEIGQTETVAGFAASNAPGDTPGDPATTVSAESPDAQAQIKQLQNLIAQYQDREKQYQTELARVTQQMNDATAQADQLQQILVALQQRGVIQISADGRISIPRG